MKNWKVLIKRTEFESHFIMAETSEEAEELAIEGEAYHSVFEDGGESEIIRTEAVKEGE